MSLNVRERCDVEISDGIVGINAHAGASVVQTFSVRFLVYFQCRHDML